jgi:hypothetical protein
MTSDAALIAAAVPSGSRALVLGDGGELVDLLEQRGVHVEVRSVDGPDSDPAGPFDVVAATAPLAEHADPRRLLAVLARAAGEHGRVLLVVDDTLAAELDADLAAASTTDEERLAVVRLAGWPGVTDLLDEVGLVVWWRLGVGEPQLDVASSSEDLLAAVLGPASARWARHLVVAGRGAAPRAEAPLVADLADRLAATERDRDVALDLVAELEHRADGAAAAIDQIDQLERELAKLRREQRVSESMARVRDDYVAELEQRLAAQVAECDFRDHARRVARNRTRRYTTAILRALRLRRADDPG